MDRIPFGIAGLDRRIGGGAPTGSVVLLAGEAGAGAREFLYTSAVVNGLAHTDPERFDLYHGAADRESLPEDITYVSFTAGAPDLHEEMAYALDASTVESGLEAVDFVDLSTEFFQLSPVPRDWYADRHGSIGDLGQQAERQSVIEAFADSVEAHADEGLVIVDSLTDLVGVRKEDELEWADIVYLMKGLQRAIRRWDGVLLIHVSREALSDQRFGDLVASADGTLLFEWSSGGNERDRTMVVKEFRGILSQLEAEDIVRFETEISDTGFDISNIRKIR